MMICSNEHAVKANPLPLAIRGIRKEVVKHFPVRYCFGDFVLEPSRLLFHKNKQIGISPKELGVLVLLLDSAGEIVTKDDIIREVWSGGNVGEESLTRCVYVLRRILREGKQQRFIDTIYGRGYRFTQPVTRTVPSDSPAAGECVFAVLPFRLGSRPDALNLHDAIVQEMAGHAASGVQVLPSSLTQHCGSLLSMLDVLEKVRPDYYLAGYELDLSEGPALRIELIRAQDHVVLHREGIPLDNPLDIERVKGLVRPFIIRHISGLCKRDDPACLPLAACDPWALLREGREAYLLYTPESLVRARTLLLRCQQLLPEDIAVQTYLAECYFALGQMGMQELDGALRECAMLVERVLATEPRHAPALALNGVLHGLNSRFPLAAEQFRQALASDGDDPAVQFYYAWHLFIVGEIKRALHFARQAYQTLPTMTAIPVLMMWLFYCDGDASAALELADRQPGEVMRHPVLLSMKAVILCTEGQPRLARELIAHLRLGGERDGIVYFNTLYARLFSMPAAADREQLAHIMQRDAHPMPSALLPAIIQDQGVGVAKKWYDKIIGASSPCHLLWRHDPRVRPLSLAAGGAV
ncbi:winged helix-turn-helix domain-containing protein [Martelella alba]|uniref:OmpR/PhoB-type domain-containing protein n=1 Tax=Martelella alba TaxID=2590451 RepID=A0ABY2SK19_9HYPH|nr:winged helix-turn-helix domain-containing protein [Martelella alba]TKI05089.1 hypothetical protein FCN80_15390 [Martelella alba]